MEILEKLEALWTEPTGPLYQLRQGRLTPEAAAEVLRTLGQVVVQEENPDVSRRLVSLVWYMPVFIQWQEERVDEAEGDIECLHALRDEVLNEVERILGIP